VTLPGARSSDWDLALVRYDSAGVAQWAKRAGLDGAGTITGVAQLPNTDLAVGMNLNGDVTDLGSEFASGLTACSVGCGVVSIVDSSGTEVASHPLMPASGATPIQALAQENGRFFVSAGTTNNTLLFAGQSLSTSPGATGESQLFEYSSTAGPVQAWSAATTSGWSVLLRVTQRPLVAARFRIRAGRRMVPVLYALPLWT
jgi:hypothetical protein